MSNDLFGQLLWNSRPGVMMQALDAAAGNDRPKRGRRTLPYAPRPVQTIQDRAKARLPSPLAAAGLIYIGAILGAALVASVIA